MKRKKDLVSLIIGTMLIVLSTFPLFLIVRENILDSFLNLKYDFQPMLNIRNETHKSQSQPITWEGSTIEIITQDTGTIAPQSRFEKGSVKHVMDVILKINGNEVSNPTKAWLSPIDPKDSRFLSWLNIVRVIDKYKNQERLAIVQRLTGNNFNEQSLDEIIRLQTWRIIYVNKDKTTSEEIFSYPERGNHLLGVKLILMSSQSTSLMGYKSDIASLLPSLFFPLIFPSATFLIGVVLLIMGLIRYLKS